MSSKRIYANEKEFRAAWYLRHRDKILVKAKAQYAVMSPEQKQRRLEMAKQRRRSKSKGRYAEANALGYRSMFEVHLVREMDQAGHEYEYEPISIPYEIKGNYKPDFVLPNGIIIEAKGKLDQITARKMKAVKDCNPDLDIRIIFSKATNKLHKNSKTMYWQWAERHNFKWAEGSIPPAWFKEKRSSVKS